MECDDEAVSWLVDKSAGSKRGNPPSLFDLLSLISFLFTYDSPNTANENENPNKEYG